MLAWFHDLLPQRFQELLTPRLGLSLVLVSVALFVATLLFVPWFVCRIPADHFTREERPSLPFVDSGSWLQPAARLLKNAIGVLLLVAGLAMLVLPGQGLLTIVIGLFFLDFPGKRRFERWLVSRPAVARGINRLRERAGQPPLDVPSSTS